MKMKHKTIFFLTTVFSIVLFWRCSKDFPSTVYKTQNLLIIVVDGARYSETWGEPSHRFIPHRSALLQEGVLCNQFYNNGTTSTVPGHTAMCTGVYENLNNSGLQYPANPSFFQYWLKIFKRPCSESWIITTKDKLEVLSDCVDPLWKGKYRPSANCGVNGLGTGYRDDSTTFRIAKSLFLQNHIRLALINFKQPDAAGHANDSAAYLKGILDTDNYIDLLWHQLQSDIFYKDKTTLIVTNDHGRHLPGHLDGFVSHGDNCDGCKHIEFFAMGPDFKKNYISTTPYEQIDITSTVAKLMGINIPAAKGKVIKDIFN